MLAPWTQSAYTYGVDSDRARRRTQRRTQRAGRRSCAGSGARRLSALRFHSSDRASSVSSTTSISASTSRPSARSSGRTPSSTRLDVRALLLRNWKLGVALGVVFGIVLVRNVFSDHATPHPGGAYYWFELLWRGGVYGAVDALLLTVLPSLVVYRSLGGHLRSWRLRLEYFGASLALIVALTAIYHLGYAQYRQNGVRAPETGNVIISMPMLLSANPIGSVADHMAMHISAVQHEYNTEVRLPPPTKAR